MHLIITIIFLALAVINFVQPSPMCSVPGDLGFLSSMWFMYLVMAVAHLCIWLTIVKKTPTENCCCSTSEVSVNK